MKSLETLYKEAQENEELKKEFVAAFKEGRIEDFFLCVYSAYALFASKLEPAEATCTKVTKFLKIAMAFSLLAITIGSFDILR